MARVSATIGVEQNSPILTPFTANRALSAATARSQVATSWQPAAAATACTLAITGLGSRVIDSISLEHCSNSDLIGRPRGCRAHFLEVVAAAEAGAGAGDDHDLDRGVGLEAVELVLQGGHQVHRQGVALRRPVQGQRRDPVAVVAEQDRGLGRRLGQGGHSAGTPLSPANLRRTGPGFNPSVVFRSLACA